MPEKPKGKAEPRKSVLPTNLRHRGREQPAGFVLGPEAYLKGSLQKRAEREEAFRRAPEAPGELRPGVHRLAERLGLVDESRQATEGRPEPPPEWSEGFYRYEHELRDLLGLRELEDEAARTRSEEQLRVLVRLLAEQLGIPLKSLSDERTLISADALTYGAVVTRGAEQEREQGWDVPELDATIRPPERALDPAAEVERAILRAAELIAENPGAAQDVLPALGKLMQHVTDSPDVLTRKEVAEVIGLGPDRIKALTAEGRIGVLVGAQNLYSRKQVEDFKLIDRPPGRPKAGAMPAESSPPAIAEFEVLEAEFLADKRSLVERFQAKLDALHELGSLDSIDANTDLARTVYGFAKRNGIQLTYNDEPVSLRCVRGGPSGAFQVRTLGSGQMTRYNEPAFPPLTARLLAGFQPEEATE